MTPANSFCFLLPAGPYLFSLFRGPETLNEINFRWVVVASHRFELVVLSSPLQKMRILIVLSCWRWSRQHAEDPASCCPSIDPTKNLTLHTETSSEYILSWPLPVWQSLGWLYKFINLITTVRVQEVSDTFPTWPPPIPPLLNPNCAPKFQNLIFNIIRLPHSGPGLEFFFAETKSRIYSWCEGSILGSASRPMLGINW